MSDFMMDHVWAAPVAMGVVLLLAVLIKEGVTHLLNKHFGQGAVMALIGGAFLLVGLYLFGNELFARVKYSALVDGVVVGGENRYYKKGGSSSEVSVVFLVNGVKYNALGNRGRSSSIGDNVSVRYNPANPGENQVSPTLVFLVPGVSLCLGVVCLFGYREERRKRMAVNDK